MNDDDLDEDLPDLSEVIEGIMADIDAWSDDTWLSGLDWATEGSSLSPVDPEPAKIIYDDDGNMVGMSE